MERIADAFAWPVRDPEWVTKVAIIAVLLLIPILGAINGIGWMLATVDRLRGGDETLAPANLGYIGRGLKLFAVQLVYAVAIAAIGAALFSAALRLMQAEDLTRQSSGLALILFTFGVLTLASVAVYFLLPALVIEVERGGMAAGLNPAGVARTARLSLNNTLIAGLMLIAAAIVGQLGAVACIVGALFTFAYSLAMQAWIFRSFEIGATAPNPA